MAISNLTPVEPWPSRKLPQDRFDASVKAAMDQMSVMVGELNDSFIPAANQAVDVVNTITPDIPAILDAPNHAAAAAASAEAAAGSASEAAGSVTVAAQEADRAKDEADRAKVEADRAESIAGVGPATVEKLGLVKPDGTTTKIDEFGTLSVPTFGGSAVGLVPAATTEDAKKVLLGNGMWGSAEDDTAAMTISEDLHLTADSPRSLVLAATTSGLSVYLPDHATLQRGTTYHIWVRPLEDIQLKDFSGEVVKVYPSLTVSSAYLLQLVDTEAGVWALAEYKSGATSDAIAAPGLNVGELKVFNSGATSSVSVTALSTTKALVCYADTSNSNYCKACVLDISGTDISVGEEKLIKSSPTVSVSVTALSEDRALVAYSYSYSNGKFFSVGLVALRISGKTISEEARGTIQSAESHATSVTTLSATKALVCYMYEGVGTCYANILSISNTSVSVGEDATIDYDTSSVSVTALSEDRAIVCYPDSNNSNQGTARVLNVSGTTISVGEKKIFNSGATSSVSVTALSTTKALVCYAADGNSNKGTACILNVSGTDVTIASRTVFNSGATSSVSVTALSTTKALVCYADTSNSNYCKACVLDISGTDISVGEEKLINYESTSCISVSRMGLTLNCVVAFNSNNELGVARIITR